MNQEQHNKVISALVVLAIFVSVFGTVMILNYSSLSDFEAVSIHTTGAVSLSIAEEPQEHESGGVININIVKNVEENMEE